jgi:hypothetical protein
MPPIIPIQDIKKVPIGMFVAKFDEFSTIKDNKKILESVD